MKLLGAFLTWARYQLRTIGHEHRYWTFVDGADGITRYVQTAFCAICGK